MTVCIQSHRIGRLQRAMRSLLRASFIVNLGQGEARRSRTVEFKCISRRPNQQEMRLKIGVDHVRGNHRVLAECGGSRSEGLSRPALFTASQHASEPKSWGWTCRTTYKTYQIPTQGHLLLGASDQAFIPPTKSSRQLLKQSQSSLPTRPDEQREEQCASSLRRNGQTSKRHSGHGQRVNRRYLISLRELSIPSSATIRSWRG